MSMLAQHWHGGSFKMLLVTTRIAAIAGSLALFSSSGAAIAADTPSTTGQGQAPNAWVMLTALNSSQTGDGTAPPAGPAPAAGPKDSAFFTGSAPLLPVMVWISEVALIIASSDNHDFLRPDSPA